MNTAITKAVFSLIYKRKLVSIFFICILQGFSVVFSQDDFQKLRQEQDSLWLSNAKSFLKNFSSFEDTDILKRVSQQPFVNFKIDSLRYPHRDKPQLQFKRTSIKPSFDFGSGYIQYNFNYRSRIDTPFAESDIIQHLITVNSSLVVNGNMPFRVIYVGRQTNSKLFSNFNDLKVDFDATTFQQLRTRKLTDHLTRKMRQVDEGDYWDQVILKQFKIDKFKELLNTREFVNLLLSSRKNLLLYVQPGYNSPHKDSLKYYSERVIHMYDSLSAKLTQVQSNVDTVTMEMIGYKSKLQAIRRLLNQPFQTRETLDQLRERLRDAGLEDDHTERLSRTIYSIRALSFGRTLPDFSPLSVKNINVKGVNVEYNDEWLYMAFTAGVIDFRSRDFLYDNRKLPPQFLYAARVGLGQKEGTHIILTGFRGKRQLFFNSQNKASELYGVSAEIQYVLKDNHRFMAEVAQSSSVSPLTTGITKSAFNFNDNSSRAWLMSWQSWFPALQTRLEGFYQHTGQNFQSFTTYRINANSNSWLLKLEQFLWKRQLRVTGSIRQNDFSNPLVVQNYESNTIFKTAQVHFKRNKWPSLSIGYIPSSQYAKIGQQIFESRYHTFTTSANHFYKLGLAKGLSTVFYSRFYNDVLDSSFLYYNARNLSCLQQFLFARFNLTIGINYTKSQEYTLSVSQGSVTINAWKGVNIELGVKIHNLDKQLTKTGLFGNTRLLIKGIGDIQFWYENNYLPGMGDELMRNEQLNIGFVRNFK